MRLAAMLKRPVLFLSGLYLGGIRYAIHFERLADSARSNGLSERDAPSSPPWRPTQPAWNAIAATPLQMVQLLRFLRLKDAS